MPTHLSKTRFTAGLQCHRLLWWKIHEPDAPELVPDPGAQFILDEGTRVGEAARSLFPGGELIDLPHDQVRERVQATERALARGAPAVFEATFLEDGVVVAVDILAREGRTYNLIEVKSSTSVKKHYLWDAAIQAYVLRRAGVDVDTMEIMHLNPACRAPATHDLFVREAVSGRVRALLPQIPALILAQVDAVEGPLPQVEVGIHCDEPYECPFKARCRPDLPRHSVETFYGLRRDTSEQFEARGLASVSEVPASFPLTVIQRRQHRSVTEDELLVEGNLAGDLAPLKGRVAYLDFETVGPAIPQWEGLGPWQPHPVQFSCHVAGSHGDAASDDDLVHREWLADGLDDCRPAMARALVEALENVDTVVAYNMAFEKKCLDLIAAGAPEHEKAMEAIKSKLRDLLPVVRNHVYHPDFLGSFSLKSVLPALVPDLRYDSLEVPEGRTANALLHRLLFFGEPSEPTQRENLRRALLDYCALDTLALVRLHERLSGLAETGDQGQR